MVLWREGKKTQHITIKNRTLCDFTLTNPSSSTITQTDCRSKKIKIDPDKQNSTYTQATSKGLVQLHQGCAVKLSSCVSSYSSLVALRKSFDPYQIDRFSHCFLINDICLEAVSMLALFSLLVLLCCLGLLMPLWRMINLVRIGIKTFVFHSPILFTLPSNHIIMIGVFKHLCFCSGWLLLLLYFPFGSAQPVIQILLSPFHAN